MLAVLSVVLSHHVNEIVCRCQCYQTACVCLFLVLSEFLWSPIFGSISMVYLAMKHSPLLNLYKLCLPHCC